MSSFNSIRSKIVGEHETGETCPKCNKMLEWCEYIKKMTADITELGMVCVNNRCTGYEITPEELMEDAEDKAAGV